MLGKAVGVFKTVKTSVMLYAKSYQYLIIPILVLALFQAIAPVISSYASIVMPENLENLDAQMGIQIFIDIFSQVFLYYLLPWIVFSVLVGVPVAILIYRILYLTAKEREIDPKELLTYAQQRIVTLVWFRVAIIFLSLLAFIVSCILFPLIFVLFFPLIFLIGPLWILVFLYVGAKFIFCEFLVVHKKYSTMKAIKMSFKLTKDRTLKLVGLILVVVTLLMIVFTVLSWIIGHSPFANMLKFVLLGTYYQAVIVDYFHQACFEKTAQKAPVKEPEPIEEVEEEVEEEAVDAPEEESEETAEQVSEEVTDETTEQTNQLDEATEPKELGISENEVNEPDQGDANS